MALLSAEIEDTPVAVPAARTPIPNSVSATMPLDFEALPVSTHLGADKLISTQPVRDKSDIQC